MNGNLAIILCIVAFPFGFWNGCITRNDYTMGTLETVFPVGEPPKRKELVDPLNLEPESTRLAQALADKPWNKITYEYLRAAYPATLTEAFVFLTSEGRRYYFPAFLKMCMEHPRGSDVFPSDLLRILGDNNIPDNDWIRGLSSEQKKFVLDYFCHTFADPIFDESLAKLRRALDLNL